MILLYHLKHFMMFRLNKSKSLCCKLHMLFYDYFFLGSTHIFILSMKEKNQLLCTNYLALALAINLKLHPDLILFFLHQPMLTSCCCFQASSATPVATWRSHSIADYTLKYCHQVLIGLYYYGI
jgi:hypothetical protein